MQRAEHRNHSQHRMCVRAHARIHSYNALEIHFHFHRFVSFSTQNMLFMQQLEDCFEQQNEKIENENMFYDDDYSL